MLNKIEGYHYQTNDYIQIEINADKISKINIRNDISKKDRCSQILIPGLFDLQVNGYGGIDFNNIQTTPEDILSVTRLLNSNGTLKYLPTVITNSSENISSLVRTIRTAIEKYEECRQSIVGIHLEGPFLSKEDGPRGAHEIKYICEPDIDMIKKWQADSNQLIKIITLSPEYENSFSAIAYCRSQGIHVSIGHTSANSEQIKKAIYAGASLSTHLGNGSHTMLPRHNNYIWDQLAADELFCTLIGDGIHLPKNVLKCMLEIKKDKALLISDSSEIAGLEPGYYETHVGGKVMLTENKRLCMAENPELLAGSAVNLFEELSHLYEDNIIDFESTVNMACVRPARFLNQVNDLVVGSDANIISVKKEDGSLKIKKIIRDGVPFCFTEKLDIY